ncbi:efflux RND transporter periplasmic adaptor subunit [Paractinoplanes hotanensis]|uniref:Efflux RND transporter periplasmic adaptor subunit n=1 Tax=Paractinoplanes hotanensis TaxID=2906497 RepID=A0ABT0Y1B6_9ACTN|nr:efflux RND transporter periplasmic adaptor subunit [Actinoplanes hotanensis]MCM4079655.1 efflux RND transporter periplasmic adaptor subunit [Actinoplanes hotanensis]
MGEALGGRRRWIWGAVAVVVLALAGFGVVRAVTADATGEPEAASIVAVDKGTVTTEVATTGTVQPAQTRSLGFSVAGTVESVAVRAGTSVTAGQVLAKVDDTDAAEAVGDAQDSLDDAEDALAEAEDNAANAATGDGCGSNVAAGYAVAATTASTRSLTFGATPKPTSTAPTPTRSATPTVSATPTTGATPTTPTGPTRTGVPTGTTAPTGSAAPGRSGSGGNPSGNPGAGASCAASGGGSQQGGAQQQGGGDAILSAEQRVTQARTALENAEEALAGATIKAPIAGRVLSVSGKVGSQITAGNSFITLADVYDMQISANFPEADADRLAVRQKAVVTLADRAGAEIHASVVQVDPVGTSDGTMVRYGVLLSFDDKPEDLLVGQSASVRVTTGARSEVLRVPSAAVHDVAGDKGVVRKGNAAIEVTIGLRGDQYTEIIKGLSAGDEIARTW